MGNLINLGKDDVKRIDGSAYKSLIVNSVKSTLTTDLEILGSGYLSSAILANLKTAENICRLVIEIDRVVIFDKVGSLAAASASNFTANGLGVYRESLNGGANVAVTAGKIPLSYYSFNADTIKATSEFQFPSAPSETTGPNGCVFIIGELIRFNSSLIIKSVTVNTSNVVNIEYCLDD